MYKVGDAQTFVEEIRGEFKIQWSYVLLLVFSTIIATLGLLGNNVSVIIGSMLISPLFWPVLGISLSVVFSDKKLTRDALYSMIVSLLIVLVTSFILTKLFPFSEPSQEILARTNPTLTDLSIALAVSVIGVMAIRYKNISQTATGVAISIALLPVLCVVGIAIAFGSWDIFIGSSLLFLANAGAIIFVGATLMYFIGVRPVEVKKGLRWNKKYIFSFFFLLILAIPLTFHLLVSIEQQKTKKEISTVLTQKVTQKSDLARTEDVRVLFPPTFSGDDVHVGATIYMPKTVVFSLADRQTLIDAISEVTDQNIDLTLNMVNTVSVQREEDVALDAKRKSVDDLVRREITKIDEKISVSSVFVLFPTKDENGAVDEDEKTEILVRIDQFNESVPLTFDQKQDISRMIEETLELSNDLTIELDPVTLVQEESEGQIMQKKIENLLTQDLATLSQEASLIDATTSVPEQGGSDDEENQKNVQEDQNEDQGEDQSEDQNAVDLNITARLFVPEGITVTQAFKNILREHLEEEIEQKIDLTLQVVHFTDL